MKRVIVLDFGSQYAHLIARRVRELGVYSEVVPHDAPASQIRSLNPGAIILSGGPASVYEEGAPKLRDDTLSFLLSGEVPVLGICYGHQLLAQALGGVVARGEKGEYGLSWLKILESDLLFKGTPSTQRVWMSHRDYVEKVPSDVVAIASTDYSRVAAFRHRSKPIYGVQFHPEVRHTEHGMRILRNFLFEIAGLERNWSTQGLVSSIFEGVRRAYRGGKVLMAVSGGVDSTTAAYVIKEVVGEDNIHLVFVDTGLLREGEPERVLKMLRSLGFKHVHFVDASKRFLERLRGVVDPEEKRKVISRTFIEVFEEVRRRLEERYGPFRYLGQGTIYPDRIESGQASRRADRIKSHHNVAIPIQVSLELLEPLKDLYKDEVRRLARALNLPEELIRQHPFPGPGLAVRVVGEVTEEKLRIVRKASRIVEEELKRAGLYEELWQAFPVLLPVRSVGVMGDSRTYEYVIALRIVVSEDAMTAEFAKLPWDVLERIASRIVNEVEGVNRVLYDITNKPPATIEFE